LPAADPSSSYNALTSVSADSASDAWAVGAYRNNTTGVRDTLILHWNGTAWSQVATPASGLPETELNGVSTVSDREAWPAGFAGTPATGQFGTLILRWNGTSWSVR
jgi:hypothetical protein